MMRRKDLLEALFPKTRREILAALLQDPERSWFLSDLASHLGVTPSSLQRELANLLGAGVLTLRRDGKRTYYRADPDCPIRADLVALIQKTAGLVPAIADALQQLSRSVKCAFIYGSAARNEMTSRSDVDLMILGPVTLARLSVALRPVERKLRRPINPSVYTLDEFAEKAAREHHFLTSVLASPRIFVKGGERELADALGRRTR